MTAAVVSLDALREQRRRSARVIAGEVVRPWQEPAKIVARFTTAGQVADDPHGVVVVHLGDRTVRGRIFLARRDRFGQVRLVLELEFGEEPRAVAVILRPEACLLLLAPAATRATRSAAPPCAPSPRGPR